MTITTEKTKENLIDYAKAINKAQEEGNIHKNIENYELLGEEINRLKALGIPVSYSIDMIGDYLIIAKVVVSGFEILLIKNEEEDWDE